MNRRKSECDEGAKIQNPFQERIIVKWVTTISTSTQVGALVVW